MSGTLSDPAVAAGAARACRMGYLLQTHRVKRPDGSVREVYACPAMPPEQYSKLTGAEDDHVARLHRLALGTGGARPGEDVGQRVVLRLPGQRELSPGGELKTDAELDAFVRARAETAYHPSCSCAMGYDEMSVVDNEGRVHGIEGLRVVDASIMPRITTGNLNAPTIMLAEKIADRIRGRSPLPRVEVPYYVANGAPARAGTSAQPHSAPHAARSTAHAAG